MTEMKKLTTKTVFAVLALLLSASTASAQQSLADAVSFLMTNQAVQTGDFERDRTAADAARDTVIRALLVNVTNAPFGTSSGGFLYRLNPALGTVERASANFGGFFVERALLAGEGTASFGITTSVAEYNKLDGHDLHDGTFVTTANQFRGDTAPFDTESVTMNLRSNTVNFWANVGVTDDLELSAVVPVTRITLDGTRVNVYRGTSLVESTATGSASGLGDIALRAKYGFLHSGIASLAASGEIRLPTGDEKNLLGAGSTAVRILGIASFETGAVGIHANGGIVRGGASDEVIISGAMAAALHPRATLAMEVMRRWVSALRPLDLIGAPHPTVGGVDTFRLTAGPDAAALMTASTGIKWNVTDTVVLSGQLQWALNARGLTAAVTPTVALEYSVR
jgi:hypothetical protein